MWIVLLRWIPLHFALSIIEEVLNATGRPPAGASRNAAPLVASRALFTDKGTKLLRPLSAKADTGKRPPYGAVECRLYTVVFQIIDLGGGVEIRTCRVCHYAAQLRANSIFCGVEDGVVEIVLRDHLKKLRDKLGFGHAGCFRPLAQPGHRNSAEL